MKISKEKQLKISEQVLAQLYLSNLRPLFTSHVAREIARDEEFIKKLLLEMKGKGLVVEIRKNPKGKDYIKRSRWKLSNQAYEAYKNRQ